MNETDVLNIHHALHNNAIQNVVIQQISYPIQTNADHLRFVIVNGHKVMVQNPTKDTKWAKRARNGEKISWVFTGRVWGRIVNGRIEQYGTAITRNQPVTEQTNPVNSSNDSNNNNQPNPPTTLGIPIDKLNLNTPPPLTPTIEPKFENVESPKKTKPETIIEPSPKKIKTELFQHWKISRDEIQEGQVLGQGGFGVVKKAKWRGSDIAIKILYSTTDKNTIEMFQKEAELLIKLRHNNVVQCYGVVCPSVEEGEDQERFIVMEYLPYNLRQWIRTTGGLGKDLTASKLYQVACGIAKGINYLHKSTPPIIHRDLKPANVLLDENYMNPKIADFGISREKEQTSEMTRIGTPHYMAPEILQALDYNESVDVYSFGMMLYEMVTAKMPYAGMGVKGGELNPLQVIMKATVENRRPEIPEFCPSKLKTLIERCWDKDFRKRPHFDEIIEFLTVAIESKDEEGFDERFPATEPTLTFEPEKQ